MKISIDKYYEKTDIDQVRVRPSLHCVEIEDEIYVASNLRSGEENHEFSQENCVG